MEIYLAGQIALRLSPAQGLTVKTPVTMVGTMVAIMELEGIAMVETAITHLHALLLLV